MQKRILSIGVLASAMLMSTAQAGLVQLEFNHGTTPYGQGNYLKVLKDLTFTQINFLNYGEGFGYNINMPMPHGSSEEDFFGKVDEALAAIRLFQPDALILTLGFDIYKDDPQAQVSVTSEGFCRLSTHVRQLGLPTLVVQEGGYDLDTLSENVQQFFRGLAG